MPVGGTLRADSINRCRRRVSAAGRSHGLSALIVSHDSVDATSVPDLLRPEHQPEVAGCPELAAALVAAVLFEGVDEARKHLGLDCERLVLAVEKQSQWRQVTAGHHLEFVAIRLQRIRRGDGMAHRCLVQAERDQRP